MEKVKKFSDEELSRILSHAHELKRGGRWRGLIDGIAFLPVGCINQAAYNGGGTMSSAAENPSAAREFDKSSFNLTPDNVLRMLRRIGAV